MANRSIRGLALAAMAVGGAPMAFAADLPAPAPVYTKAPAAVAQSGGFYAWADGSYQSISRLTI
jgi:hypothetical protein